MSIFPESSYKYNVIPEKNSNKIILKPNKLIWTFIWKSKEPRVAKTLLTEKNQIMVILQFDTAMRR